MTSGFNSTRLFDLAFDLFPIPFNTVPVHGDILRVTRMRQRLSGRQVPSRRSSGFLRNLRTSRQRSPMRDHSETTVLGGGPPLPMTIGVIWRGFLRSLSARVHRVFSGCQLNEPSNSTDNMNRRCAPEARMKCRCVEYNQIGATSGNGQRQLVASRLWRSKRRIGGSGRCGDCH
jgi:hypothetical protein